MPYQCDICGADRNLKRENGCVKPSQFAVWEYGEDQFFNCPWRFVPPSVLEWWAEFWYYSETSTFPKMSEIPDKWVEAMLIYKHEYRKAIEESRDKRGSGGGFGNLREQWLIKKAAQDGKRS